MDGRPGSPACSLSLILPAFNEAPGIPSAIAEADEALARLVSSYELIVVDDGSDDGTPEVVRRTALEIPRVRLVQHETNQGYGAALRSGFEAARGERIAFTDADCQFHLDDLGLLLAKAETTPVVVGYRLDRKDPWRRRFFSWGYNVLARTLLGTGVRDVDCALKVFHRESLPELLPQSRGFFVNTEMLTLARQKSISVAEVAVRHRPRLRGATKVSLADIPKTLKALLPFWWSRVAFAGGATSPLRLLAPVESNLQYPREAEARPAMLHVPLARFGLPLIFVMACLLFFGRLASPLLEPEEARYAEIPRQMLAEGRFLTPVLHGQTYLQKPPLLYWMVMASYRIFGVHDWAARLVPCVCAIATVLLTYFWARRTLGRPTAVVSAGLLCLCARFVYLQGMLSMDAVLCLWTTLGWMAAHLALREQRLCYSWWIVSALACGLGLLTKGPVALALILVPTILLVMLDTRTARIRGSAWLSYLTLALAVAAAWYGAMALQYPGEMARFFWLHNVVRYAAPFDHEEPIWFFVPSLLAGTLPWSLLLLPLGVWLGQRSSEQPRPAPLGYFLLALFWCVGFFSLSGCKRASYILPALPLVALVLGTFFTHGIAWARVSCLQPRWSPERWAALGRPICLATLATGAGLCLASALAGLSTWDLAVGWCLTLALATALLARWLASRSAWTSWAACGSVVFTLLMLGVLEMLPDYHRKFGLENEVRVQTRGTMAAELPVASYPRRWDSISFYLQRNDVQSYSPQERTKLLADLKARGQTLLFIKAGHSLHELLSSLPPSLEFVSCSDDAANLDATNLVAGLVRPRTP